MGATWMEHFPFYGINMVVVIACAVWLPLQQKKDRLVSLPLQRVDLVSPSCAPVFSNIVLSLV
jgi:hypothetical protein